MQHYPSRRALLRVTTLPATLALRSGAPGLALAAGAFSRAAGAQSVGFPSKPITIIVPAAPGGILDQCSRLIAGELTKAVKLNGIGATAAAKAVIEAAGGSLA